MRPSIAKHVVAVSQNLPLPPASVAGIALVLVFERVRPAPLPGPPALRATAGAALLATGGALNAWAVLERRRRTSGEFQLEQPESIVATGPYAITRHPMYLGWWLLHLGTGVLRGSAWVAATLPIAVLVEHVAGSLLEERQLERRFGAEYTRYAERVPRYAIRARRPGRASRARRPRPPQRPAPDAV